jgi:hypothetical protein
MNKIDSCLCSSNKVSRDGIFVLLPFASLFSNLLRNTPTKHGKKYVKKKINELIKEPSEERIIRNNI